MQAYHITISLKSAFATTLKGDTLFGQFCWSIRNRFGEKRLNELLTNYANNQPFAIFSDAFPLGYLPLPKLPSIFFEVEENADRKALKKRIWLPEAALQAPLAEWLNYTVDAKAVIALKANKDPSKLISRKSTSQLSLKQSQPHNTINRQTNTTGENEFSPYSVEQEWFVPSLNWNLFLLLDNDKISVEDSKQCLQDIGDTGYGKDASIGLGKFSIEEFKTQTLPAQLNSNACLTLAPCAPQGLGFDSQNSYYQLFTRFGRHGDMAAHQEGKPFKNPLLLAQTSAVFSTEPPVSEYIGQGIGGNGELSATMPSTVHQGYAPVIAINLISKECQ